jgi:hypothetical protein
MRFCTSVYLINQFHMAPDSTRILCLIEFQIGGDVWFRRLFSRVGDPVIFKSTGVSHAAEYDSTGLQPRGNWFHALLSVLQNIRPRRVSDHANGLSRRTLANSCENLPLSLKGQSFTRIACVYKQNCYSSILLWVYTSTSSQILKIVLLTFVYKK